MDKIITFVKTLDMNRHIAIGFIAAIASTCLAATDTPTMGWSSWNTYRVNISDSLIMRQADALVKTGLDSAGYRYINIDDGYFGGRDSVSGQLKFHPQRFPNGLKPVVDHIHSLGLKAGIYSDAGMNTCGHFWDKDSLGQNVGLYGHDDTDCAMMFGELGFDFIKVDFCGGDARQNQQKLDLDPEKRYREIRAAIDRTGRKDVRLNVCRWNYPGTWVSEVASSWRTTPDISCSWNSIKSIINENLYLSAYAGNGKFNDMDMLEVGRGLTPEEEQTHFGMWCMMASPLLIGCDLTSLNEQTLSLLKNRNLIELNQDRAGQQAYVAKADMGRYILVRDVVARDSVWRALAFYNPTDSTAWMDIDFADIQLGGKVNVLDLISGSQSGPMSDSISACVPPHGVRLFRLTGEKRLMRTRYEAETAFIPTYQELANPIALNTGYYKADGTCSGGMIATQLGGDPDNRLEWNEVICPEDGLYTLYIKCLSPVPECSAPERRKIHISVNGETSNEFTAEGHCVIFLTTKMRKGKNRIVLSNPDAPMPDIDYMDIFPQH